MADESLKLNKLLARGPGVAGAQRHGGGGSDIKYYLTSLSFVTVCCCILYVIHAEDSGVSFMFGLCNTKSTVIVEITTTGESGHIKGDGRYR